MRPLYFCLVVKDWKHDNGRVTTDLLASFRPHFNTWTVTMRIDTCDHWVGPGEDVGGGQLTLRNWMIFPC